MSDKTAARNEQLVARFNRDAPVGSPVDYRRDNGRIVVTRTRSAAWVLSGHTPVVMIDGMSGCVLLTRVTLQAEREAVP